ncbi:uncharacterized protein LOC128726068 [Anopheles nili]|uniref:uncharacterized protein LOC128726068 n=1 Tax=Anopheles nili TaxID=185578 RepID=UPI00237B6638|nr:uncharacterized protein LOC128726068 [Anopheles nili]
MPNLIISGILCILCLSVITTGQSAARRYGSASIPARRPLTRQLVVQCPAPYFPNGEAKLRNRGRMMRFDCSYGFKIVGNRYSNCQNGRWDTSIPVCVKSGCSTLPLAESGYILYEQNKATAWLSCFEGTELAGSRYTYCNGTHWDRPLGVCRKTGEATPTTCDFESESLCSWTNDALHDFDWKRSDGTLNPRALRTGPKYDHTTMQPKAGHFVIVDSNEQLTNDTARFISPMFEPELSTGACFKFYYHMYGEAVGTLKVYVKPMASDLYDLKPLFTQEGNQKNVWHEGYFDIAQQTERFQVVFEASLGMRYKSDIAIDDVSLLQGESCRQAVEDGMENPDEPPTDVEKIPVMIESCENRCGSSMAAVLNSSDTIVHCDCHEDCVMTVSCCPDYRERCVFDVLVPDENVTIVTTTTTTTSVPPTTPTTTTVEVKPTTTTSTSTTSSSTVQTPSTSPSTVPSTTSTEAKTTPRTSSSTPVTTTKRYNLRPSRPPLVPMTNRPRLSINSTTVATTPTTRSTTAASTSTVMVTKEVTKESDMVTWNAGLETSTVEVIASGFEIAPVFASETNHNQPSLMKIFMYTVVGLTLFVVILSLSFYHARKSRSGVLARLKEKSQKSGFEDIRFLAGEEDLDFNISHEPTERKGNGKKDDKSQETKTQQIGAMAEGKQCKKKANAKCESKPMENPYDDMSVVPQDKGRDGDSSDDSTDEEGDYGGAGGKKTHSKANKKPYQKYLKHHDEDMESTLL